MASTTVLALSGIGVPDYSARGLKQTLEPIDLVTGDDCFKRTVNGKLIYVGAPQMQKYKSEISGSDVAPPACDGVWPGQIVTVDLTNEIAAAGVPGRAVVAGSDRTEDGFYYYRMQLVMMVKSFSMDADEWAADVAWKLLLEEI